MAAASVGVVIPSYNHAEFIGAALQSVFAQTRPPDRVLVLDDGSSDNSLAVIEELFQQAGSITCELRQQRNQGISQTRNALLAAIDTDFVAFLDSDDLYAATRLERMLEGVDPAQPYLGFSGTTFLGDPEESAHWEEAYREELHQVSAFATAGYALLRANLAYSSSNMVVSRSLLERLEGFDARIRIAQDWDFALQALRWVEPTFVPERLFSYRIHPRNTSRDAHLTCSHEVPWVIEKFATCLAEPTANTLAPTPYNWPRYFAYFAALVTTTATTALRACLATRPAPAAGAPATNSTLANPAEAQAIRRLLSSTQTEPLEALLHTEALLELCHARWLTP